MVNGLKRIHTLGPNLNPHPIACPRPYGPAPADPPRPWNVALCFGEAVLLFKTLEKKLR